MNSVTEIKATDYLPPKLREIAEVIGDAPALKLSDAWCGVRLFVPATITPEHPITLAIGLTAAEKLSRRYGGETITVPKASAYRLKLRDALIVDAYRKGASGRELALKYGVHENHLYSLIAKHEAKRQPDLFGGGA